jgi:ribosome maturation factor RimP
VEVLLNDEVKKEGTLKEVTDDTITIEQTEGKGKKAVPVNTGINFTEIKQTKVLIKF